MQRRPDKLEIGVLYGFRALMVLCVVNYHLWQQSWIPQYFTLLGHHVSMDFWTRSSYVFVDGMILLSGFLLYLPYARQKQEGTPVPTAARFYFNRAARILPSYLFAVLAALLAMALLLAAVLALMLLAPALCLAETTDAAELAEGADIRIMSYNILHPEWNDWIPIKGRDQLFLDILQY